MSARKNSGLPAIDYQATCEAPVEEFVKFVKTVQRSKTALVALAASPAADLFATTLAARALSGEPHASPCLGLLGKLARDSSWRAKIEAAAETTAPPAPDRLRPKDIEPVGRLALDLLPGEIALAWIAFAYLSMKGTAQVRSRVEALLLESATTSDALLDAIARALAAVEATADTLPRTVTARAITTIENHAQKRSAGSEQSTARELSALAGRASRDELTRLVHALLTMREAAAPASAPGRAPFSPDDANGDAAWVLADQELAIALQEAAALTHALDLATDLDPKVRGYADLVTQAVESVAARREMALGGAVGETTAYDPTLHQDDIPLGPHAPVRVRRPAVVQGRHDPSIIRKAEIAPPSSSPNHEAAGSQRGAGK